MNNSCPRVFSVLFFVLLLPAMAGSAIAADIQAEPFYPCTAAGPDAAKAKAAGEELGAARCAELGEMVKAADPAVSFAFKNAAGLCRITYQEGLRHLSNACGVEALYASHVRYLGTLLRAPVGSEQIERLARAEQVGVESDIQMNTARKVTRNILAFHHAVATNIASEGITRIGGICDNLPRIRARVSAFDQLPEKDRIRPAEKQQAKNDRSLVLALSHCDAALAELRAAQEMNALLVQAFDQGAARHQVSSDRAQTIQADAGQIGVLLRGIQPSGADNPGFQTDLLAASRKEPACREKLTGFGCARLIESPDFVRKTSRLPGGAIDRLSAEILSLAGKELAAYGTDPTHAAEDFAKWAGFPLETAVQLLPKVEEEKDDETLASLFKGEMFKNLRTDYVNDFIADLAGESRFGMLVTVVGQGTLEAAHDHVIEHAPMNGHAILVGMAKNATALAGPLWGPVGDGMVDFIDSGDYRQGIAAFAGGMVFDGTKWALERYAPMLSEGLADVQPYAVGGYYAFKAAQYGVFRLGQAEIEWGLPAGVKLEQSSYDYVATKYADEGIQLDPRRSYFGLWKRLLAVAHVSKAK